MKKLTLLFVFMLAAGVTFGQFTIGPKIGYNTSNLTTDLDSIKSDVSNNFNFGIFVRFGKKIYLQPELNYVTSGGFLSEESGLNPFKQEITMKSIEIPVILGWRILNFGVGNIRILAGPSASITVDKEIKSDETEGYIQPIEEADLADLVWGFNLGAGVDVLMFTVDVRYQMGISDVISSVQNFNINSRNNMWAISLGWKIL